MFSSVKLHFGGKKTTTTKHIAVLFIETGVPNKLHWAWAIMEEQVGFCFE